MIDNRMNEKVSVMKTPEQIAEEAITADAGVPNHLSEIYSNTFEGVRDLMVRAIKADRAQRASDLEILADAAASWTVELGDYVIPAASKEDAAAYEEELDRVTAAIGRYLDEKEQVEMRDKTEFPDQHCFREESPTEQRDPFTGRVPLIPEGNSRQGQYRIHHQNGIPDEPVR